MNICTGFRIPEFVLSMKLITLTLGDREVYKPPGPFAVCSRCTTLQDQLLLEWLMVNGSYIADLALVEQAKGLGS